MFFISVSGARVSLLKRTIFYGPQFFHSSSSSSLWGTWCFLASHRTTSFTNDRLFVWFNVDIICTQKENGPNTTHKQQIMDWSQIKRNNNQIEAFSRAAQKMANIIISKMQRITLPFTLRCFLTSQNGKLPISVSNLFACILVWRKLRQIQMWITLMKICYWR